MNKELIILSIVLYTIYITYKFIKLFIRMKKVDTYINLDFKLTQINKEVEKIEIELQDKKELLEAYSKKTEFIEVGFFDSEFEFYDTDTYKEQINSNKALQKDLIKSGEAVFSLVNLDNNKDKDIKKMINNAIKMCLLAFNSETNNYISNVSWSNYKQSRLKIKKSFDNLNSLNENMYVAISEEYLNLKLDELKLVFEKEEKLKIEKETLAENIRRSRDIAKEEEKLERDKIKAEKEELYYLNLIKEKEDKLIHNHGKEISNLNKEIEELKDKLAIAQQNKLRAISMAQQTKAGFVYIISNIGSFGENIYKIGLTRRLDPMERISELSGASVPFKFNLHALIYSTNAPSLENELHTDFEEFRVNLINNKKEFFKIPTKEIKTYLKINYPEINFIEKPEAKDYIETLALQKDLKTDMYE